MGTVLGFHTCSREFAEKLQSGALGVADWEPSRNPYDWLGRGVYFWEDSYRRAVEWAKEYLKPPVTIIEARIELGRCFDLTKTEYLDLVQSTYESLVDAYRDEGNRLPENRDVSRQRSRQRFFLPCLDRVNQRLYQWLAGIEFRRAADRKLRELDCLVMNQFFELMESGIAGDAIKFQTVRCPFEEGNPIFPGSMIRSQTHIQIAVRDPDCISPINFHNV